MTTCPTSPFIPYLLSTGLEPFSVDRVVRYYHPLGYFPVEGRSEADMKDFRKIIDRLRTCASRYGLEAELGVPVRVELFTDPRSEQHSATFWDWHGHLIIQVIEASHCGPLLLDYLGVDKEVATAALTHESAAIVFYDETNPEAPTWRWWPADT